MSGRLDVRIVDACRLSRIGRGRVPSTPEQAGFDLFTGGADRVAVGVPVGDPFLAAQGGHGNSFDIAAHDVGLAHVVREAIVVTAAIVDPKVFLLLDDDGRLDLNLAGEVWRSHGGSMADRRRFRHLGALPGHTGLVDPEGDLLLDNVGSRLSQIVASVLRVIERMPP